MTIEQIRLQAQDETTAPDILTQLASSEDKLIRQYVASNPNTPIKTLAKLGEEFPDEIVANPIFDLLFLENPESQFISVSLARSSTTSIERLEKLVCSKNKNILIALGCNSIAVLKLVRYSSKHGQTSCECL